MGVWGAKGRGPGQGPLWSLAPSVKPPVSRAGASLDVFVCRYIRGGGGIKPDKKKKSQDNHFAACCTVPGGGGTKKNKLSLSFAVDNKVTHHAYGGVCMWKKNQGYRKGIDYPPLSFTGGVKTPASQKSSLYYSNWLSWA